ncbi:hypothetical protein Goshw_012969 [Gossypium schwendimanii]|uniref:RNase H type-1 domain-containing protein n=1 Tax=Gossypium schwendimanii TaxID=34291 RepID=A0A7J9L2S5_GOSSC|nr:hypothetical protein [Gossypium schwendimanii]
MNHNEVKLNVHASGTRVFLPVNWVHLFTNGAVNRGSGATFAGGLLRDQNRDWVLGYNYYLGKCAVFEAKLWGILDGMLILLSKGCNLLVKSGITALKRVQWIMRTEKQWLIRYVPIKDNQVADYLAKLNLGGRTCLQVYDEVPHVTLEALNQDKAKSAFDQFNLM